MLIFLETFTILWAHLHLWNSIQNSKLTTWLIFIIETDHSQSIDNSAYWWHPVDNFQELKKAHENNNFFITATKEEDLIWKNFHYKPHPPPLLLFCWTLTSSKDEKKSQKFKIGLPRYFHSLYISFLNCALCFQLSLIHIWRCRRSTLCRSRWSPYH